MKNEINARVGQRLKKVRERLGFSLKDICKLAGINHYQTLSDIENGERTIKVWELSMLSDIYSKDSSYFIQKEEPQEFLYNFAWRDRKINKDACKTENKIQYLHSNYRLFEELTDEKTQPNLIPWNEKENELTIDIIISKAESLVEQLNLGRRPATELLHVIENTLNIKVIFLDLDGCGSALASYNDTDFAIFINEKDAPWRRNYDMAHELFHLYSSNAYPLEKLNEYEKDSKSWVEKLADEFAATLLMPEKSLIGLWENMKAKKKVAIMDFIKAAEDYQVSTSALLIRMKNLRILDGKKVDDVLRSPEFKLLNSYNRSGKNVPAQTFSKRFIWLGIKALKNNKISKGKFCKIFDINKADFASFLAERGFSEDLIYGEDIEFNYS